MTSDLALRSTLQDNQTSFLSDFFNECQKEFGAEKLFQNGFPN